MLTIHLTLSSYNHSLAIRPGLGNQSLARGDGKEDAAGPAGWGVASWTVRWLVAASGWTEEPPLAALQAAECSFNVLR